MAKRCPRAHLSLQGQDKSIFLLISITGQFLARPTQVGGTIRFLRIINRPTVRRIQRGHAFYGIYLAQCAIYNGLDVNGLHSGGSEFSLYRKSPCSDRVRPFVRGAIWRQRLVSVIVIAIFRSCFLVCVYFSRTTVCTRQYAVFTERWAHHRPDSK